MGGVVLSLLLARNLFKIRISIFGLSGGLYLAYTILYTVYFDAWNDSSSSIVQGGTLIFAMLVYRNPREYRIILTWITYGMAGFGFFLTWQSITDYKPPWFIKDYFLHDIGSYIRAGEGFGEKNYSAALLVLGFVIAWSMAAYNQMHRGFARAAMVGCALGILFTFSRGAFVALTMVLICYALSSSVRFGRLFIFFSFLAPFLIFFMGNILELAIGRFSISSAQDVMQATSRLDQIVGGLNILANNSSFFEILFGNGPFVLINTMIIHNIPIGILVEQGLFGLLIWICLILMIGRKCFFLMRNDNPYPLMALVGFLVAGTFIRIEVDRNFWLFLLFAQALPYLLVQKQTSGNLPSNENY